MNHYCCYYYYHHHHQNNITGTVGVGYCVTDPISTERGSLSLHAEYLVFRYEQTLFYYPLFASP